MSMPDPPKKTERRTQEERTATMRRRLLEATVECLVETGYSGTSTNAVTKRAGVSRGALLHHFPTKQALVTTAVEYIMRKWSEGFVLNMAALPQSKDTRQHTWEIVQRLWADVQSPMFLAWVELLVAARTDEELAKAMLPVVHRYHAKIEEVFRKLYGFPAPLEGEISVPPRFTFSILIGMMLERLTPDPETERRLLRAIAATAETGIAATEMHVGHTALTPAGQKPVADAEP